MPLSSRSGGAGGSGSARGWGSIWDDDQTQTQPQQPQQQLQQPQQLMRGASDMTRGSAFGTNSPGGLAPVADSGGPLASPPPEAEMSSTAAQELYQAVDRLRQSLAQSSSTSSTKHARGKDVVSESLLGPKRVVPVLHGPNSRVSVIRSRRFAAPVSIAAPLLLVGSSTGIAALRPFVEERWECAKLLGERQVGQVHVFCEAPTVKELPFMREFEEYAKRSAEKDGTLNFHVHVALQAGKPEVESPTIAYLGPQADLMSGGDVADLLKGHAELVWRLLRHEGGFLRGCGVGTLSGLLENALVDIFTRGFAWERQEDQMRGDGGDDTAAPDSDGERGANEPSDAGEAGFTPVDSSAAHRLVARLSSVRRLWVDELRDGHAAPIVAALNLRSQSAVVRAPTMSARMTLSQVASCRGGRDGTGPAWWVYRGEVFDVTRFVWLHPGGEAVLEEHLGRDVTEALFDAHVPSLMSFVEARMAPYRIGYVLTSVHARLESLVRGWEAALFECIGISGAMRRDLRERSRSLAKSARLFPTDAQFVELRAMDVLEVHLAAIEPERGAIARVERIIIEVADKAGWADEVRSILHHSAVKKTRAAVLRHPTSMAERRREHEDNFELCLSLARADREGVEKVIDVLIGGLERLEHPRNVQSGDALVPELRDAATALAKIWVALKELLAV